MIYQEAKQIALKYNNKVNACFEYDKGFLNLIFNIRGINYAA